jgi:hypothetical protein
VGIEPKQSDCKSVDLPSASGPLKKNKPSVLTTGLDLIDGLFPITC